MAEVSRTPVNRLVGGTGTDNVSKTVVHLHEHLHSVDEASFPITFPFEWRYGDTVIAKIDKLSEEELRELVESTNGTKDKLMCTLCGAETEQFFRKESGNVVHLICEACTMRYVIKARALQK